MINETNKSYQSVLKNISGIFILLVLFSCQKDDLQGDIVGKWELITITAHSPVDFNENGNASVDILSQMEDNFFMKYTFEDNGDFSGIVNYQNDSGVAVADTSSGPWSLSEDMLIMGSETYQVEISREYLIMIDAFYHTVNENTVYGDIEFKKM